LKISKITTMTLLALLVAAAGIMANSSLVSATGSCTAQLAKTSMGPYYDSISIGMTVPVSATCSFSGGQLYAVGNVYDMSINVNLGSAGTVLTSVNGGNVFNGQLVLTLPTSAAISVEGHTLQISVSIYDAPYGSILTSTTQTMQVPNYSYSEVPNYSYPYPSYYYPGNCYYSGSDCYYGSGYFGGGYFSGGYYGGGHYRSPPPWGPPSYHHEHPSPPSPPRGHPHSHY
jgi:hypothetical protein